MLQPTPVAICEGYSMAGLDLLDGRAKAVPTCLRTDGELERSCQASMKTGYELRAYKRQET